MASKGFSRRAFVASSLAGTVFFPGFGYGQGRQDEGGIGGTGIVGILTDFGSLIVAGRRVETDGATRVTDAFGARLESDLRIGDSLTVEARGANGALLARRVHVTYPLAGAVSQAAGRMIRVNGVDVVLEQARSTPVGSRVLVSGLWDGNRVVASRIETARDPRDLISGTVSRRSGGPRVGPIAISGNGLFGAQDGSFAAVLGRFDAATGAMVATSTDTARFTGAAGPLERLAIEGYLEPINRNPGVRVSGLGHNFARGLVLDSYLGNRLLFDGRYTGRFAAEQVTVLPEAVSARRALLRSLA